jgi:peptidoglycan/xylan/chitin deacetylase (PgdA/CDA1 family)
MTRRIASLSLDLDNEWSYLKTHGAESWTDFPSYLDIVTPHILRVCDDLDLTITVFVVGQDAALPRNQDALAMIGDSRHEIGNHSFHHEPWLHLKPRSEIHDELTAAHEAIAAATGKEPTGFRGPGFSLSQGTLQSLQSLNYSYDCSTFPTFIGPFARAYYFRQSALDDAERKTRTRLFGTFAEVFRPIKPYSWDLGDDNVLVEVPVTTMPLLRVPIHISYLLFLARYSEAAADLYFRSALRMCRFTGVQPSILLHALDLLGGDDVGSLGFFPAMDMAGERKRQLVARYIRRLASSFEILTMAEHVETVRSQGLKVRRPSLPG